MRKKVDSRVRILVENAVALRQRAFFVMVGDRGRDQVVNLHYMLSKITTRKPSVLWCYKKELGFSSHRKKRMKQLKKKIQRGLFDPNIDDPFELFVSSTRIRYCYYKETDSILGQTFGMCILQDFEALTPNILCRTLETVEGGGIICILLQSMTSLRQLYNMTMDIHRHVNSTFGIRAGVEQLDTEPRFNERFILSLSDCQNCLIVDDELNILPLSRRAKDIVPLTTPGASSQKETQKPLDPRRFEVLGDSGSPALIEVKRSLGDSIPAGPLVALTVTLDQAKVLMSVMDVVMDKTLSTTLSLTAGRGRGKSATLGLSIASALAHSYSNIFVTAPSPENIGTVFEFIHKGLIALGYKEHADFELVEGEIVTDTAAGIGTPETVASKKHIIRINVFREHRQTVQYITPTDISFARQAEILVIDEAAAIPLPIVSKLIGPYLVILSSTVNGYEGTGRALSLKLLRDLKERSSAKASGRVVKELELTEPIRYALGDPVEGWLNKLLCLDATTASCLASENKLSLPSECRLYEVNRQALFSYHKASELFLHKVMSLFVSSHYKNSPNDLLLLSDAPAHHIFVLLPPLSDDLTDVPDVLVAIQVAIEGSISKEAVKQALSRGLRPSGDLLPWTLSQNFIDEDFGLLNGVRIVRIATHPSIQRLGYGTEALRQLCRFYENSEPSLELLSSTDHSIQQQILEESASNLLQVNGTAASESGAVQAASQSSTSADSQSSENDDQSNDGDTENQASSLRTEILRARDAPPLLVACKDATPTAKIHYIGTSFGLSLNLFKFYSRLGFQPVYLRQTVNDITGDHSVIMLRGSAEDGQDAWLNEFVEDFRNRMALLLGSVFRSLPIDIALSLVVPPTLVKQQEEKTVEGRLPVVTHETISQFFSRHDLLRLERYSQQLLDRSMILDLIPTLAWLLFTGRLQGVGLSHTQYAVLLAIGLQRKTIIDVVKEFDVSTTQVAALFNKALFKLHSALHNILEAEAVHELQQRPPSCGNSGSGTVQQLQLPDDLPSKNFEEELDESAKIVRKDLAQKRTALLSSLEHHGILTKYALEGVEDTALEEATRGKPTIGSVSVKTKRHTAMNNNLVDNPGFSLKKRTRN